MREMVGPSEIPLTPHSQPLTPTSSQREPSHSLPRPHRPRPRPAWLQQRVHPEHVHHVNAQGHINLTTGRWGEQLVTVYLRSVVGPSIPVQWVNEERERGRTPSCVANASDEPSLMAWLAPPRRVLLT
jgi:hypothetical protein